MKVHIEGTDFSQVATLLGQGGRQIPRQLQRDLARAARPLAREMQQAIRSVSMSVDQRDGSAAGLRGSGPGGLRSSIAAAVHIRPTGAGAIIDVETGGLGSRATLPALIDSPGRWRHPTLGNRRAMVTQHASPTGWFTRTAQARGAVVVRYQQGKAGSYLTRLAASLG